jgi:hypothetical protein
MRDPMRIRVTIVNLDDDEDEVLSYETVCERSMALSDEFEEIIQEAIDENEVDPE